MLFPHVTDDVAFREENRKIRNAFLDDLLQFAGDDLGVCLDDDLTGLGVDRNAERLHVEGDRSRCPFMVTVASQRRWQLVEFDDLVPAVHAVRAQSARRG